MIRSLLFLSALCLAAPATAQQPAPQQPVYGTLYGAPRPLYRTPLRTGLWYAVQPRAYYVPTQQVQIVPACPHCRR